MTTYLDSQVPIVLVSEFNLRDNTTNVASQLYPILLQASQELQALCRRRFDNYQETRYYSPYAMARGGDLGGIRELYLDADLLSVTAVVNGDGTSLPLTAPNMQLLPPNELNKRIIRLNPFSIYIWYHSGTTDSENSISVTGTWGYPGSWQQIGTLSGALDGVTTTIPTTATLEQGQLLSIDSEYLLATSTTAAQRGANGSAATTHLSGASIMRFYAPPLVKMLTSRIAEVIIQQIRSPLFGTMDVGGAVFPFPTAAIPKDVLDLIRQQRLMWVGNMRGSYARGL